MMFDGFSGLIRVAVMAVTAYAALIIALRIAGKRSLAKLNAFDLVVTVAIGSTLATIILSKDVALMEGVLALAMLLFLQWIVARLSLAWPRFRDAVRSEPRVVFEDGAINDRGLREERLTPGEVEAAIRSSGVGSNREVAAVVLEADGTLSVIRRGDEPPDLIAELRR